MRSLPSRIRPNSLFWRVVLIAALIMTVRTGVLAVLRTSVGWSLATEVVVLLGSLTAASLAYMVLVRRAFSPLDRLMAAMRGVEPLQPGQRLPTYGSDREVVELTETFNEMVDRLGQERRESVRGSLRAQEAERRRVALELHDEIGQRLTAVVLGLDRLARDRGGDGELIRAREEVRDSLESVRALAQRLRPEALDTLGLTSALTELTDRLGEQCEIPIRRTIDPLPDLPEDAELALYRVAQEGLTNAVRHAGAESIELTLTESDDDVVLRIADDGRGLNGAPPAVGIQGMRERALLVGGKLTLESREGAGTLVAMAVPAARSAA